MHWEFHLNEAIVKEIRSDNIVIDIDGTHQIRNYYLNIFNWQGNRIHVYSLQNKLLEINLWIDYNENMEGEKLCYNYYYNILIQHCDTLIKIHYLDIFCIYEKKKNYSR